MTAGQEVSRSGRSMVSIEGVGKRYVKYEDSPVLLTSIVRAVTSKSRRSRLWAVRNVDLEVAPGETVGVIGRNGSGKSTLLRMLAGVTAPSEGALEVRGRVAPLISVGVGFHPELTGRENVYVNGTILGLTRKEIDDRFDSIVDFSEIADFIDTPVKFYSSGMFVRLGFAVAVTAEPDVLLVDEVLSVGDMGFQTKSFIRMGELQQQGTTILVVSHNLAAVRNLCPRVLVLHDGTPRFMGPAEEAISVYQDLVARSTAGTPELQGASPVEFSEFEMYDKDGVAKAHVDTNENVAFKIKVKCNIPVTEPVFSLTIATDAGMPIYADSSWEYTTTEPRKYDAGEVLSCEVRLPARLVSGSYTAVAGFMWDRDPEKMLSTLPIVFLVAGRGMASGLVDLGASFTLDAD